MEKLCVRGVVHDGQIVLEAPLSLPDGTAVTVTEGAPKPVVLGCSDAEKRRLLTVYNRLDLIDDPDWEEKVKTERIAAAEQLARDAEALRKSRLAAEAARAICNI
jgi:hypothetical protein